MDTEREQPYSSRTRTHTVLGGDAFTDLYRAGFGLKNFWNLTDPEYCVSVMEGAYLGGCRSFEISFDYAAEMLERLESRVGQQLTGIANPSHLQGTMFRGRSIQYARQRILKTLAEGDYLPETARTEMRGRLRESHYLFFGYERDAEPLSDKEIAEFYLDEDAYRKRLKELGACPDVLVGATDADWLFSLGREDIIARMCEIVWSLGKTPYLDCHYVTAVLPKAMDMKLDVAGYYIAMSRSGGWFDHGEAERIVRGADRPVYAFMAFDGARGDEERRLAASYLKETCGIAGIMYGTTDRLHAEKTAEMLTGMFDS